MVKTIACATAVLFFIDWVWWTRQRLISIIGRARNVAEKARRSLSQHAMTLACHLAGPSWLHADAESINTLTG